ncbi:LuxR C-terminal-related transcriptional regulator [Actinocatenispora sera]|uniref:LuxR C-terminal-related transcriptional regulator n=1 Tax=Actinocatenispora sera TaxID=390989 RepID=UPI0033F65216
MTAGPRRAALLCSGRETALAELERALRRLRRGRGGRLTLVGPPGSGRTELLAVAGELAAAAGILSVDVHEGRPLSLYRLGGRERPDRQRSAVLLCVDDVERCDGGTRRVAEFAAPSLRDTAVLWLVTTVPVGPVRSTGQYAEVGELSRADADELALRSSGRTVIDAALRAALDAAPRYPLHVVQTARRGVPWPAGLVAGLAGADRRMLAAAAALGPRFSPDDLAEVVDRPVGTLLVSLLASIEAGLLRADGDELAFSHRLVQDLVAGAVPEGELAVRAVRLLARQGAADKLVAALRGQRPPELDPATLREVAEVSARRDPSTAAVLSRLEHRALADRHPADVPATQEAAARIATYAVQSGDPVVGRAVSERLDTERSATLGFAVAEVLLPSHPAGALRVAQRAADAAGADVDELHRVRLAAVRLAGRAYADDCEPAELAATEQRAARLGDPRSLALIGLARTLDTSAGGDLVEALRHASMAGEAADRGHGPQWWIAGIFRAKLLTDLGRLGEAEQLLDALADRAERTSQIGALPNLLMGRATCDVEAGRLAAAEVGLIAARQLAHAIGRPSLVETNVVNMLVRVAYLRGDTTRLTEYREVLERQLAVDPARSTSAAIGLLFAVEVTSAVEIAEWARLSERLDGPRRYAIARGVTDDLMRLRILLRHGLRAHAVRLAGLIDRLASITDAPLPNAAAGHADGVVHRRVAALRAAREAYQELGRPMLAAQALEDLADVSGDPQEQADALRDARAVWYECGAHRETARVDKLLRASGLRAAATAAPELGLGLTVSEERVVREVVAGRSNRAVAEALFLSPHTVAVHLRRIYGKTGVRNRRELTELIRRRAGARSGPADRE